MIAFDEDTGDFRGEYQRRVGQISELLTSPSVDGGPLSRRLLVKAQSGSIYIARDDEVYCTATHKPSLYAFMDVS